MRDAEGRSSGPPLTPNFSPCLKNKRKKACVKVCEGECDVVGVVAPLGGVAQVIFHGVQVVEVGVQVRVHQDRGVVEDGEGQVEVEWKVEEVREKQTCATWLEDDRHVNDLSQCGVTHD